MLRNDGDATTSNSGSSVASTCDTACGLTIGGDGLGTARSNSDFDGASRVGRREEGDSRTGVGSRGDAVVGFDLAVEPDVDDSGCFNGVGADGRVVLLVGDVGWTGGICIWAGSILLLLCGGGVGCG